MEVVSKLSERLKELMFDCGQIKSEALAKQLKVSGPTVRSWMNGKRDITLANAIKVADFFECSLDYLAGISDVDRKVTARPLPPFYENLRKVMDEQGVTRYQIAKNVVADVFFTKWVHGGMPMLYTACKLAQYLHVSLDYLVGRTDY